MWALLFRRVRVVVAVAVVLPVVATTARRLAARIERGRGGSTLGSRGLRLVASGAGRARGFLR